MNEPFSAMLRHTTIRARVAFALAIAGHALELIEDNLQRIKFARAILEACWDWERGNKIKGEFLLEHLEREDGTGLMHYPGDGRKEDKNCWEAIVAAGYYTAWHAYQLDGEKILPETINEVDETQLDYLVSCALSCLSFDQDLPTRLAQICLTHYPATPPDELGEPIDERRFFI